MTNFVTLYDYFSGIIGFIWSVVWFLVVFDSPADHPRISKEERDFIEKAIGNTTNKSVSKNGVPQGSLVGLKLFTLLGLYLMHFVSS